MSLRRRLSGWVSTAVITIALSSSACSAAGFGEAGRILTDLGVEVFPSAIPMIISLIDERIIDEVSEALDWINAQTDLMSLPRLFANLGDGPRVYVRVEACNMVGAPPGVAPEEIVGQAALVWDEHGAIQSCTISICDSYLGQPVLVTRALRHELLHCYGLEDDPPSLDRSSVMSRGVEREDVRITSRDEHELANIISIFQGERHAGM